MLDAAAASPSLIRQRSLWHSRPRKAASALENIRAELGEAWPVPLRDALATVLRNRGIAKARGGDLAGAITMRRSG